MATRVKDSKAALPGLLEENPTTAVPLLKIRFAGIETILFPGLHNRKEFKGFVRFKERCGVAVLSSNNTSKSSRVTPPPQTRTPPNERKERKSPENFTFFLRHANRHFSLSLSRPGREKKQRKGQKKVMCSDKRSQSIAPPIQHTDPPSQLENLHPPLASLRIGSCYEKIFAPPPCTLCVVPNILFPYFLIQNCRARTPVFHSHGLTAAQEITTFFNENDPRAQKATRLPVDFILVSGNATVDLRIFLTTV